VQAKNHHYSVAQLLANNEKASEFSEGFFATIYLSPRDCIFKPSIFNACKTKHQL
jgi:phosphatidylserine decarboxylase